MPVQNSTWKVALRPQEHPDNIKGGTGPFATPKIRSFTDRLGPTVALPPVSPGGRVPLPGSVSAAEQFHPPHAGQELPARLGGAGRGLAVTCTVVQASSRPSPAPQPLAPSFAAAPEKDWQLSRGRRLRGGAGRGGAVRRRLLVGVGLSLLGQ